MTSSTLTKKEVRTTKKQRLAIILTPLVLVLIAAQAWVVIEAQKPYVTEVVDPSSPFATRTYDKSALNAQSILFAEGVLCASLIVSFAGICAYEALKAWYNRGK